MTSACCRVAIGLTLALSLYASSISGEDHPETSTEFVEPLAPVAANRPRSGREPAREKARPPRMSAEFEHQTWLCLSSGCLDEDNAHADMIAQIARVVRQNVGVVVLATSEQEGAALEGWLLNQMDSLENITILPIPHDTKWIRDFGPTVLRRGDRSLAVDWHYKEDRPNDDEVPLFLSELTEWDFATCHLTIEGGNLLSNGQGLCLTTQVLLDENRIDGNQEATVRRTLRQQLGIRELVVLEPLIGELTGHIDMFATFTDANTVVVGQYDRQMDPDNAEILDRNAARLAKVRTSQGPLRVVRIPMGRNDDGVWRTYTNCIYANGLLLVPAYSESTSFELKKVVETYRRLLPGWRVVPIDSTRVIEEGGALHCISLNVP